MNLKFVRIIDFFVGVPLAYTLFSLKRLLHLNKNVNKGANINNILLIKFWGIGNVIMLLPAVKALKEKYPKAKIDFLTLDKNYDVSFAANIFEHIHILGQDNAIHFASSAIKTLPLLFKSRYEIIIDFEQFARISALICALISRNKTIGFKTFGQHRHFLYTDFVLYNNYIHMTKSFLSLTERAGVVLKDNIGRVEIAYDKRYLAEMDKLIASNGASKNDLLIVLHIGTSDNFSLRRWPAKNFAVLANRLIDNYKAKIIFTGLSEEKKLVTEAVGYIKDKKSAIDVCGSLAFNQFVSIIRMSDLVVSCDTSTVHIGSCLSIPVVGLYGPNTPLLYGPWNENSIYFYKKLYCSPCITNYNAKLSRCRNPEGQGACMQKISVDEVFKGIEDNYLRAGARFRIKKLNNKW